MDKRTVVKTTAVFVAMMTLFATAVRALVAQEIDLTAVPPTLAAVAVLLLLNRYVHRGGSAVTGGWGVISVVMAIYAYLSLMSHGFLGSTVFAAPVFPVLAWVLLDRASTRLVTILVGLFLMLVLNQHLSGRMQPQENFPEEIRHIMKSVVLLLSLIAVYWMISFKSVEAGGKTTAVEKDESKDPLTGLLSRSAIDDAIRRELVRTHRATQPLSLMVAEVDGFDLLVNDIGVAAADKTLLGVAKGLQFCMRRSADYLGRYGDSQFAVLMPDTDSEGAGRVAEKFCELMEALDIPYRNKDTVRMAVTVAAVTSDGVNAGSFDTLHGAIDGALKRGRAAGGNQVVVEVVH